MQILKSLRSRFATLSAWQPGYHRCWKRFGAWAATLRSERGRTGQAGPGASRGAPLRRVSAAGLREWGTGIKSHPQGSAAGT